jgi:hypothetical protein
MIRENLSWVKGAYPNQSLNSFLSANTSRQLLVHSASAYNGSAAAGGVGIGHSMNSNLWKVFSLGVADTEVTSSIQSGTAITLFSTTNGEGVLFQAKHKFELVSFVISQAQTGSPVYAYTYWNGSSWASLSLKNTPSFASAEQQSILFDAPIDWEVGDGSEGGDESLYSIRVLATTAPSQAVQIDELKICKVLAYRDEIYPKGVLNLDLSDRKLLLQQGESLIGFFQFPSPLNTLEASYQNNP